MKNLFSIAALTVLMGVVLGCSSLNPFSGGSSSGSSSSDNRSLSDRAVDTAVGNSKIGVPECDEVMDLIDAELNNPEDDFVTKAIKATVLNRIKDGIRDSVQNSNSNTNNAELAKTCREFKTQFEKFKAEQRSNSNSQ